MTDANAFVMPGRIEAGRAASIIKRKLAKNKCEFIFPHPYPALEWVTEGPHPLRWLIFSPSSSSKWMIKAEIVVALAKCAEYVATDVSEHDSRFVRGIGFRPARGTEAW